LFVAGGEGEDTLTFISVEFSMMQVEDRPDTISSVTIILLQGRAQANLHDVRDDVLMGHKSGTKHLYPTHRVPRPCSLFACFPPLCLHPPLTLPCPDTHDPNTSLNRPYLPLSVPYVPLRSHMMAHRPNHLKLRYWFGLVFDLPLSAVAACHTPACRLKTVCLAV